MRKIICILLCIASLFVFCSCDDRDNEILEPVNFYYRTEPVEYGAEASIITAEVRDAAEFSGNYARLIAQYLNGPRTYDCISPFPAATALVEFTLSGNKAYILLSPHMSVLSGSELMVACACLSKTVIELTGVEIVQISAEGNLLNNQEYLTFNANSFSFYDVG